MTDIQFRPNYSQEGSIFGSKIKKNYEEENKNALYNLIASNDERNFLNNVHIKILKYLTDKFSSLNMSQFIKTFSKPPDGIKSKFYVEQMEMLLDRYNAYISVSLQNEGYDFINTYKFDENDAESQIEEDLEYDNIEQNQEDGFYDSQDISSAQNYDYQIVVDNLNTELEEYEHISSDEEGVFVSSEGE